MSSVHDMTRVVIRFAKSDLQSVVQSAAEFHDRNLPGVEHVLLLPVSGASFLYQKNGARNPVHTGKFSGARNLRQKTCQSDRGFNLAFFWLFLLISVTESSADIVLASLLTAHGRLTICHCCLFLTVPVTWILSFDDCDVCICSSITLAFMTCVTCKTACLGRIFF